MTSKIPPLLSSYIRCPPHGSLTLLTSVLSASTNWLILRYLYAYLDGRDHNKHGSRFSSAEAAEVGSGPHKAGDLTVVLVSWMRDWEFWKTEARRAVGLDLVKLEQQGRLAFVDGLTNLFAPSLDSTRSIPDSSTDVHIATSHDSPSRSGTRPPPTRLPENTASQAAKPHKLSNSTIKHLTSTIFNAISTLTPSTSSQSPPPSKVLLILDSPSLLLQSTTPSITSTDLSNTLLSLRNHVHATVVALPADGPLVAPAATLASARGYSAPHATSDGTPLEIENAAFAVGMAHQACCVLSCRMLGTGFADDVSGVIRVTRGGSADDFEGAGGEDGGEGQMGMEDGEWLYFVGGDGSVKVWSRGAGGEFDVG